MLWHNVFKSKNLKKPHINVAKKKIVKTKVTQKFLSVFVSKGPLYCVSPSFPHFCALP